MKKFTLANCLTVFRLFGAVALIFLPALTIPFYIVYSLCGLSDALDGPVARLTKTSGVTGRRSNQLSYRAIWWEQQGSNL